MGHSRVEKAKTHQRIVALASQRLREQGVTGIAIAELMKDAGLTVGGFYKHFASRDALVAEALRAAHGPLHGPLNGPLNGPSKHRAAAVASGRPAVDYHLLIDGYLSESHRDRPGTGCPVGALAGDLARSDQGIRALIDSSVQDHIATLANSIRKEGSTTSAAARSRAILTYCALIGAINLARAVSDKLLSGEILKTAAKLLKNPAAKAVRRQNPLARARTR